MSGFPDNNKRPGVINETKIYKEIEEEASDKKTQFRISCETMVRKQPCSQANGFASAFASQSPPFLPLQQESSATLSSKNICCANGKVSITA